MFRYLAALFCCLCVLTTIQADDKARMPNTLTPEEIADGWILLFDGETTFGWKTGGEAKIQQGVIQFGGDKQIMAAPKLALSTFELSFECLAEGQEAPRFYLAKGAEQKWEYLTLTTPGGKAWHSITITCENGQYAMKRRFSGGGAGSGSSFSDPRAPVLATTVGFEVPVGSKLSLRNVKIKPLNTKTIFTGKDLTGWKEVTTKDTKSVFTVTDKGELNIKNGPGDLHTEGEWDDFVLQLDVISNGQRLNSGVFFRCVPGKFWSGYEAQIRNEWLQEVKLKDGTSHVGQLTQKDDTATLRPYEKKGDRYEPAKEPPEEGKRPRNKPPLKLAKTDIESVRDLREQPVDFGTGGLYNRQPSRKVVSSDGEYCTMTVIAHGDHIAIWVNGYQTVDFTDTAKDAPSARQGRKLGKGPISLQGHDPTTDLSFKNIRIAPLEKAEK